MVWERGRPGGWEQCTARTSSQPTCHTGCHTIVTQAVTYFLTLTVAKGVTKAATFQYFTNAATRYCHSHIKQAVKNTSYHIKLSWPPRQPWWQCLATTARGGGVWQGQWWVWQRRRWVWHLPTKVTEPPAASHAIPSQAISATITNWRKW